MEADVVCHRLTPEAAFLLKTVKRMLYLGYVLLRYVLIYNLEVSFDFYLTFLQLDVIMGVFLSVNPKTDFRSKNGFRVPFDKSKSGFLIW